MSQGIRDGGYEEYLRVLREEEEAMLAPLRQRLESATDPSVQRELKDRIQSIQAAFEKKRKAVTKYDRVLAGLEDEGYITRAIPADLGAKLEKTWKSPLAVKCVDDRDKTFEAIRRLI